MWKRFDGFRQKENFEIKKKILIPAPNKRLFYGGNITNNIFPNISLFKKVKTITHNLRYYWILKTVNITKYINSNLKIN